MNVDLISKINYRTEEKERGQCILRIESRIGACVDLYNGRWEMAGRLQGRIPRPIAY